jgi:hypothetical protein
LPPGQAPIMPLVLPKSCRSLAEVLPKSCPSPNLSEVFPSLAEVLPKSCPSMTQSFKHICVSILSVVYHFLNASCALNYFVLLLS